MKHHTTLWSIHMLLLPVIFMLTSCQDINDMVNGENKTNRKVSYSYACLDSAVSGGKLNRNLEKATDVVRDLAVSERSVTDEMQTEYGQIFHDQMIKEGSFKLNGDAALAQKLNKVLQDLLKARERPSDIGYQIYALNDSAINAFTFGGRIYITNAMLKECQGNDPLLYAIIGHEIGHSESGHIRDAIQGMILSNKLFGQDYGNTAFTITRFLTASFNQRKELEADYYGIDLTNALGYDVCTAVGFWKKMADKENSYNQVEDFFRTHPFSKMRAQCLMSHISDNFDKSCGGLNKSRLMPEVVETKAE